MYVLINSLSNTWAWWWCHQIEIYLFPMRFMSTLKNIGWENIRWACGTTHFKILKTSNNLVNESFCLCQKCLFSAAGSWKFVGNFWLYKKIARMQKNQFIHCRRMFNKEKFGYFYMRSWGCQSFCSQISQYI